jgi:hypothetical protein
MGSPADFLSTWAAAGLRYVQVGMLNSSGLAIGDGAGAPAQGAGAGLMNMLGFTGFQVDVPDPVTHDVIARSGADKWSFQFAPEGNPTVTATAKMMDMLKRARITGTKVEDVALMKMGVAGTDQDGSEPQVMVMVSEYGSSGDETDFGNALWVHQLIPLVKFASKPFSMTTGATESEFAYNGKANQAAKTPWGKALSLEDNGCTRAACLWLASEHMVSLYAYTADGSDPEEFTLPYTPAGDETSGRVTIFDATSGAEVTPSDVDVSTRVVQFAQQTAGNLFICLYEIAAGGIT